MMLRLLAVDTLRGAVHHASAVAPAPRPIQIGAASSCAMRLAGLYAVAVEIDYEAGWRIRFPGTERREVADGSVYQLGSWTLAVFVDLCETAPAVARLASERLARALPVLDALALPHFAVGERLVPVDTSRPLLVGSSARCDVVLNRARAEFAAVVRSVDGHTFLYPLAGPQALVDGRLVSTRTRLRNGTKIVVAGAEMTFVDPASEVARSLGEARDDEESAAPPIGVRLALLAKRVPWLEVGLTAAAIAAAAAFAALYAVRY